MLFTTMFEKHMKYIVGMGDRPSEQHTGQILDPDWAQVQWSTAQ